MCFYEIKTINPNLTTKTFTVPSLVDAFTKGLVWKYIDAGLGVASVIASCFTCCQVDIPLWIDEFAGVVDITSR